ncbi:hypothetical protein [Nostoc sp.]
MTTIDALPRMNDGGFWVQAAIAGTPVLHCLAHWTTPCPAYISYH